MVLGLGFYYIKMKTKLNENYTVSTPESEVSLWLLVPLYILITWHTLSKRIKNEVLFLIQSCYKTLAYLNLQVLKA